LAASATARAPADVRRPERQARRALRRQIARLGAELDDQRCSRWPRCAPEARPPARPGRPRLLSLGELEALRDELVATLGAERRAFARLTLAEERARRLREAMMLDPAAHPGARLSHADVGEPGCGAVRCEPALGLLGMLMGWWRVVLSSGCP
jgi:hypothetical protein